MNNPFGYMIQSVQAKDTHKMVDRSEYEIFCKEYIFEKLKGFSFGYAFCKRFDISNYMISNVTDDSSTKSHIELFYIK
jgi:hypothetical protein